MEENEEGFQIGYCMCFQLYMALAEFYKEKS